MLGGMLVRANKRTIVYKRGMETKANKTQTKEDAMTHTPGPWQVIPEYSQDNVYRLWDADGNYHDDTSPETLESNAHLIAAAPELLEALKGYNLIDYTLLISDALVLNTDPRVAEILEELSAAIQQVRPIATQAIAKAEGREG